MPADRTMSVRAAQPLADDTRLTRWVGGLPERLLLILMWVGIVVGLCTVAGQLRPLLVVPLAVVVVVATWRLRPAPPATSRRDAVAVVACLALLVTWLLVQLPHTGERLVVTRDPDVYSLTALWLVDHPSVSLPVPQGSQDSLGFDLDRGALQPQGAHLVPALSATVGWVAGSRGVLAANLIWGAAGLLGVFALARRLVGSGWALVPVAALALSQPMVAFSRSMYSEPLSLAMSMLAGCLLLAAWESARARDAVLCGLALGTLALTRVDGLLVAAGVIAALSLVAVLTGAAGAHGRRWGSLLVAAGCAPLAVLAAADLYLYTGVYFDNSVTVLSLVTLVALLATAGSVVIAWAAGPGRSLPRRLPPLAPRAGQVLAGGLAVLLIVLWSRPWWQIGADSGDNTVVTSLQQLEGSELDGSRTYSELTVWWLSWYFGPVTLLVGGAALTWWLYAGMRDRRSAPLLLVAALTLPTGLVYLVAPLISPDQIWAVRRFLPAAIPGLLLATAWGLRAVAHTTRTPPWVGRSVAAVLTLLVVGFPASTLPGVWTVSDRGGLAAGVQQVCDAVAGRPAVVSGVDTLLPTVAVVCGVPVYGVSSAEPARLAEARLALGGGDIALVTRDTAGLPDGSTVVPVQIDYSSWEARLLGRPNGPQAESMVIAVGTVGPDGRVTGG